MKLEYAGLALNNDMHPLFPNTMVNVKECEFVMVNVNACEKLWEFVMVNVNACEKLWEFAMVNVKDCEKLWEFAMVNAKLYEKAMASVYNLEAMHVNCDLTIKIILWVQASVLENLMKAVVVHEFGLV